ncbi:MAG: M48 family metalloprotease [Chlamydiia bacterium]|nr:M48 family metalloprotease [Chlamydiia bacterium]
MDCIEPISAAAPACPEEERSETSIVSKIAAPFFALFNYFYGINPVTEKREFGYLPQWVEKAMGASMYFETMQSQGRIAYNHHELPKTSHIFDTLKTHAKRDLPYELHIIKKNEINAWCMPGGKVAVFSGILEKIDYFVHNKKAMGLDGYTDPETGTFISYAAVTKDDVIAALLGHEMTHADARHFARKLELTFLLQAIFFSAAAWTQSIINGKKRDLKERMRHLEITNDVTEEDRKKFQEEKEWHRTLQTIHNIAFRWVVKFGMNIYLKFGSRQHELEADKYGTRLMVESGYNPAGALFLQEILKRESGPSHWYFFSTHPEPEERQAALCLYLYRK